MAELPDAEIQNAELHFFVPTVTVGLTTYFNKDTWRRRMGAAVVLDNSLYYVTLSGEIEGGLQGYEVILPWRVVCD